VPIRNAERYYQNTGTLHKHGYSRIIQTSTTISVRICMYMFMWVRVFFYECVHMYVRVCAWVSAYECMWCLCSCIHESVCVCDRTPATAGRMGVPCRQCGTTTYIQRACCSVMTRLRAEHEIRLAFLLLRATRKHFVLPWSVASVRAFSAHAWQRMSHHGYFRLRFWAQGL
jgi:hypothetical protein